MDIIHDVTQRGDVKSLKKILAANPGFPLADPKFTSFLQTPLHVAAMQDYIDFASEIVRFNPLLANEKDSQGFTPLHLATARYNVDMVRVLLSHANTDACISLDQDGRTPLHLAAVRNEIKVMDLLIQSRPEAIHQRLPNTNETILHLCVKHNAFHAMKKLVDYLGVNAANLANIPHPISVNSVDSDGNTILHLAAQMKRMKQMLKYLLGSSKMGVEVNIRNTTPEELRALDMLDEYEMYRLGISCYDYNTTREVRQQSTRSSTKWLKERLSTIMIVAALIAGVSFQALIGPPGGVFQEDSKIDAITDPVMFTYYLRNAIGNHAMSYGFLSYSSHILNLPPQETATGNITEAEIITYRANFVQNLVNAAKSSESLTRSVFRYKSQIYAPGIVLEDDRLMNITSNYNTTYGGGSGFSPYLIRYAGTAILAYTSPKAYESYILLNSLSLVVCGLTILVVTFDAIKYRPSGGGFTIPTVVCLEVLLAIAVACISVSYMVAVATIGPPFYEYRTLFAKLMIMLTGAAVMPIARYFYFLIFLYPHTERRFSRLRQCPNEIKLQNSAEPGVQRKGIGFSITMPVAIANCTSLFPSQPV
ncbi:hypothetical protein C5167_041524 [Papaver somniferum]|nr:hypothetical protein C5167_041524 [Papaver somniferum]